MELIAQVKVAAGARSLLLEDTLALWAHCCRLYVILTAYILLASPPQLSMELLSPFSVGDAHEAFSLIVT